MLRRQGERSRTTTREVDVCLVSDRRGRGAGVAGRRPVRRPRGDAAGAGRGLGIVVIVTDGRDAQIAAGEVDPGAQVGPDGASGACSGGIAADGDNAAGIAGRCTRLGAEDLRLDLCQPADIKRAVITGLGPGDAVTDGVTVSGRNADQGTGRATGVGFRGYLVGGETLLC